MRGLKNDEVYAQMQAHKGFLTTTLTNVKAPVDDVTLIAACLGWNCCFMTWEAPPVRLFKTPHAVVDKAMDDNEISTPDSRRAFIAGWDACDAFEGIWPEKPAPTPKEGADDVELAEKTIIAVLGEKGLSCWDNRLCAWKGWDMHAENDGKSQWTGPDVVDTLRDAVASAGLCISPDRLSAVWAGWQARERYVALRQSPSAEPAPAPKEDAPGAELVIDDVISRVEAESSPKLSTRGLSRALVEWVDSNPVGGCCDDRSCMRCRMVDLAYELEIIAGCPGKSR
jgi:hypothetical protein